MRVFNDIDEYNVAANSVVGIGCFDALHLGHHELIKSVVSVAKKINLQSTIISIENYKQKKNITTKEEKEYFLNQLGIDNLVFQHFNEDFKNKTAKEFMQEVLVNKMSAKCIVVGENFRFGQGGQGDIATFESYGLECLEIPIVLDNENNEPISSTLINKLLLNDELEKANKLMGRNFNAFGTVDYGKRLASKMGYPTANIYPVKDKLCLSFGVYATLTYIDGVKYHSVTNVGINPTTDLTDSIKIETHIFDLEQDIYKKKINVEFLKKIRGEKEFKGIDELFEQIKIDKEKVKNYFENS